MRGDGIMPGRVAAPTGARRVRVHVTGIVQGVGMRPFVYREARARGLFGWVLNAADGVHIEAQGEADAVDAFVVALSACAPAAARVEHVNVTEIALEAPSDDAAFRIIASDERGERTTLVSPDIATCDDCLRELFDPADRRFHYPFINCTNCGPRFTIIRSLPYDRPATSMDAFPMCPDCAREYADPADRRFHAQPDACFACGPHITWRERDGADACPAIGIDRTASDAIIERCAELLAGGGIVAIKGLGGFHLACNAADEQAVRELRRRKRRSRKPLAIMVRGVGDAERWCTVDGCERELLAGSVRPIVLLRRRVGGGGAPLASSVAYGLPELGVMLPYTPLQHLLMAACAECGVRALVMTSGNISEEPIEIDDEIAWENLGGIADALLGNDRAILSRFDDSVVRVVDGAPMPVRRARGYAPTPLPLPHTSASLSPDACVLACGPEQKATVALTRENPDGTAQCFVSQHIGDIENATTFDAWHDARTRLETLFDLQSTARACDTHPGYLSSQWARARADEDGRPLVEAQHHHAHIASVLAEAACEGIVEPDAPVVGIAFDGTGAGTDGTVWGGEVLIADLRHCVRAARLAPWRLPGGAASVRDARRCALALLATYGLLGHPGARRLLEDLTEQERSITLAMVERGINSPLTSSMGRFLDACAAIVGIRGQATYEGEPAIELEAAAWRALDGSATVAEADVDKNVDYAFRLPADKAATVTEMSHTAWSPAQDATFEQGGTRDRHGATGFETGSSRTDCPTGSAGKYISDIFIQFAHEDLADGACAPVDIDLTPLLAHLLDSIEQGAGAPDLALLVHQAVARMAADVAERICEQTGIRTVALSGGVFMNRLLLSTLRDLLESRGITALVPHAVPVNDGCIAYGQAAIARARLAAQQARA